MWSRWVRWRGPLVCAIDGTIMTVADTAANLAVFTKQRGGATGGSSYPMLRLVALVCCGTRRRGDGGAGQRQRDERAGDYHGVPGQPARGGTGHGRAGLTKAHTPATQPAASTSPPA